MEFIDAPKISEVERIKQLGLDFKDVKMFKKINKGGVTIL